MITDEDLKRAFENAFIEYDEDVANCARQTLKDMSVIFDYREMLECYSDYFNIKTITLDENTDFSETNEYEEDEVNTILSNAPVVKSRNIIINN